MKIALCSDVHLEFGEIQLKNPGDVDVLILSGDICVAKDLMLPNAGDVVDYGKSTRYHKFFKSCSEEFKHVIYVAGNHEHYHGDFKYTISHLKTCLSYLDNIHILDKEKFEIDDFVFVGGTLWTNMNNEDPVTMYSIKNMMNDFRCVMNSNHEINYKTEIYKRGPDDLFIRGEDGQWIVERVEFKTKPSKFWPEHAVDDHKKMVDYIVNEYHKMSPWKKMIVVGHHTPSLLSCHPVYKDDEIMNGGYHSDLSAIMLSYPKIKLWTHGHTHDHFDYMVGETRVVCNPRGYIDYEDIADNFELKVIEL
jgi:predicted phosphodiesterase